MRLVYLTQENSVEDSGQVRHGKEGRKACELECMEFDLLRNFEASVKYHPVFPSPARSKAMPYSTVAPLEASREGI